jgi:hypothetical protein
MDVALRSLDASRTRNLSAGLGILSIVFGVVPFIAPRLSAQVAGIPLPGHAAPVIVRSVGVRDAVIGMGLWSAAVHGGNYSPWLLARVLCDAGDTVAVGMAVARGARDPRLLALGALALSALASGLTLYMASRAQSGQRP